MMSKGVINVYRLKQLRIEKKLKQSDVAKIFNCTQQMISKYETSDTRIPCILEEKLALFYGCSIDYLRGLTNVRNSNTSSSILSPFYELGIMKEGQDISPEYLALLREFIGVNKCFFKDIITSRHNHLVEVLRI